MENREELVAAVRAAAERLGVRRLSVTQFRRETDIGVQTIYRFFESWRALCVAAGLQPIVLSGRVPEENIFAALPAR